MKKDESEEFGVKVNFPAYRPTPNQPASGLHHRLTTACLEKRVIALERGLEAVLRRLEESGEAEDEAGWFGRPE